MGEVTCIWKGIGWEIAEYVCLHSGLFLIVDIQVHNASSEFLLAHI